MRNAAPQRSCCWAIYVGEALTDRSVKPAIVYVSPKFHEALYEYDIFAWQSLLEYSEELVEEQADL